MANCSAEATITTSKGKITRARINCPEGKADDECKCKPVIIRHTLGNLQYEHKFCSCESDDDADPDGDSPEGYSPSAPEDCHLEMTVVWEVGKEYDLDHWVTKQVRIIDVQVFCVGKCIDNQKCPDKPKVDSSTEHDITTEIYTCPCGAGK
jgi:hypothetical protein